jgi:hypothetical protein
LEGFDPSGERFSDLGSGVFLNEVKARNRHFNLVGPSAAYLTLAAHKHHSRVGVYKQLRDLVARHPVAVLTHDPVDVSRFTVNG